MEPKLFQFEGMKDSWFTESRKSNILMLIHNIDHFVKNPQPIYREDGNLIVDDEYLSKNFTIPVANIKNLTNWWTRGLGNLNTGLVSNDIPLVHWPEKGPNSFSIDTEHKLYRKTGDKNLAKIDSINPEEEHIFPIVMSSIYMIFERILQKWECDDKDWPIGDLYNLKDMLYTANLTVWVSAREHAKLTNILKKKLKKMGLSGDINMNTINELLLKNRDSFYKLIEDFSTGKFYDDLNITFHNADEMIYKGK